MKLIQVVALCVCTSAILLNTCAAGWNHTTDAMLEMRFRLDEAEFQALLSEVRADSQLTTIQRASIVYAGRLVNLQDSSLSEVERLGLPAERWIHYQKQLTALGLAGVLKGGGNVHVSLIAAAIRDCPRIGSKLNVPTSPGHFRKSLDSYRISDEDKDEFGNWAVYEPLKGNWYLYLFVNR